MDWIKTVVYIAAVIILLGFLPVVCVVYNRQQQFLVKVKYLGVSIYTFKYNSKYGPVNRLFIFKLGKKRNKDNQELSFDEKVKQFQEKTLAKLDELSAENDRTINLREKYADNPKKLKQIDKIDRKRRRDLRKKKLRRQLGIFKSALKNIGDFLKHSKISKLNIDFTIATPDVAQRAVLYGTVCAIVYNSISLMKRLMKVDIKKVDIQFSNNQGTNQFNGSLKYKIPGAFLVYMAIKFFRDISKLS